MGNFITNPHHIENNLVYSNDKNIWAVYTLTAPTISTSSIEMIEAAQNTSASLLYTLAKLPMKEATLAGFKGMLAPEQLYTPILESVKNYSPEHPQSFIRVEEWVVLCFLRHLNDVVCK